MKKLICTDSTFFTNVHRRYNLKTKSIKASCVKYFHHSNVDLKKSKTELKKTPEVNLELHNKYQKIENNSFNNLINKIPPPSSFNPWEYIYSEKNYTIPVFQNELTPEEIQKKALNNKKKIQEQDEVLSQMNVKSISEVLTEISNMKMYEIAREKKIIRVLTEYFRSIGEYESILKLIKCLLNKREDENIEIIELMNKYGYQSLLILYKTYLAMDKTQEAEEIYKYVYDQGQDCKIFISFYCAYLKKLITDGGDLDFVYNEIVRVVKCPKDQEEWWMKTSKYRLINVYIYLMRGYSQFNYHDKVIEMFNELFHFIKRIENNDDKQIIYNSSNYFSIDEIIEYEGNDKFTKELQYLDNYFKINYRFKDKFIFSTAILNTFLKIEEYEKGIKVYEILLKNKPTKSEDEINIFSSKLIIKVKYLIMMCFIKLKQYNKAIEIFFSLKTPNTTDDLISLMNCYIECNEMDYAIHIFEKYIKKPSDPSFIVLLNALINSGNIYKAENLYKNLINNIDDINLTNHLSNSLLKAYSEEGNLMLVNNIYNSLKIPSVACRLSIIRTHSKLGNFISVSELVESELTKKYTDNNVKKILNELVLESLAISGQAYSAFLFYQKLFTNEMIIENDNYQYLTLHSFWINNEILLAYKMYKEYFKTPTLRVKNKILEMLSEFGHVDEVKEIYNSTPEIINTESKSYLIKSFCKKEENNIIYDEIENNFIEELYNNTEDKNAFVYAAMVCYYVKKRKLFKKALDMALEYPSPVTFIELLSGYYYTYGNVNFISFYLKYFYKYQPCFTKETKIEIFKNLLLLNVDTETMEYLFLDLLDKLDYPQVLHTGDLFYLIYSCKYNVQKETKEHFYKLVKQHLQKVQSTSHTLNDILKLLREI
ncbi:hypothetical protein ABK040_010778 [Willaertia magna]